MKILLIDDEQAVRDILSRTLQTAKYEVITSQDGTDGITQAKMIHPDIILLDQILPDMNGNQVLQILKANQETKNIPIIMLASYAQEDVKKQALDFGAAAYLLKHVIGPQDLLTKIATLLQAPSMHTATSGVPPIHIEPAPTAKEQTRQINQNLS